MTTIKFNNEEFRVENYSKNTYLSEDAIVGDGSCVLNTANIDKVHELMQTTIESIQIINDDNVIYDLNDIEAHITNINEYLEGGRMVIVLSLHF